ncbi:tetratricopeptide repeat protein [Nocardia sp. NPDC003482]
MAARTRGDSVAHNVRRLLETSPQTIEAHQLIAALDDIIRSDEHEIETDTARALLTYSLTYMLDIGADNGFDADMAQEFATAVDRLIEVLHRKRENVTDLLLTLARFHSQRSNVGDARLRTVRLALAYAETPIERMDAMLGMAQFENDRSSFPAARRWLARCEAAASRDPQLRRLYDAVFFTRQGLTYFSSNAARARWFFEQAIEAGTENIDIPQVKQAVAEAHHYIGRVLAQNGDLEGAAAEYMIGRKMSGTGLSGSAYFHLRMAELLFVVGDLNHARFHLDQSDKAFKMTRNDSDGRALLAGAWAQFFLKQGDINSAEDMIADGLAQARQDGLWRPQLILLQQLVFQRLAQRWWRGAVTALLRAVMLFFLQAPRDLRNLPASVRQAILLGARAVAGQMKKTPEAKAIDFHCPCGS